MCENALLKLFVDRETIRDTPGSKKVEPLIQENILSGGMLLSQKIRKETQIFCEEMLGTEWLSCGQCICHGIQHAKTTLHILNLMSRISTYQKIHWFMGQCKVQAELVQSNFFVVLILSF